MTATLKNYRVSIVVDDMTDKDVEKLLCGTKVFSPTTNELSMLRCENLDDKFFFCIDRDTINSNIPIDWKQQMGNQDYLELYKILKEYFKPIEKELYLACISTIPQAVKDYMDSRGVRLLNEDEALYYGQIVPQWLADINNVPNALEQQDFVNNSCFNLAKSLVETTGAELEWDIGLIEEITEVMLRILERRGHRVWYPRNLGESEE